MLDDLAGALIGGMIGEGIAVGVARGRAKRKARRFLAGETVQFRAHLRFDGEHSRRGRLRVSPGTEEATWTRWPRWGRPEVELMLLGGKGFPDHIRWGSITGNIPAHGWRVRTGPEAFATLLLERNYLAVFAPLVSLGDVPFAKSHRRHKPS
ncbi:hypothetical protein [Sporichthya polymorpha]|uniref:hypothetical protein n=1 Tax=Sporichthya polymorpha TaxID=35751 RepID=UPI0012EB8710|nr:hypothetical protein [Sporichthya polymorpha]